MLSMRWILCVPKMKWLIFHHLHGLAHKAQTHQTDISDKGRLLQHLMGLSQQVTLERMLKTRQQNAN